ncbi:MAG: hypothetical protein FWH20_08390 [Oscillospiraceae bacterium]|nr:hypothetical protein [Oscillospiraceae bacterium]
MNKFINKYFILDVSGTLFYGLILYFGFTWLSGFSLLLAYLWNLVLIGFTVLISNYTKKLLQSDEYVAAIKEKYGAVRASRILTGGFVSFKTLILLFYLLIVIMSQIIEFYPHLINTNLAEFILSNQYNIVFLLAIESLIRQFSRDKEMTKQILAKLEEIPVKKEEM